MTERNMQLQDWLDDLCVRFLMNGPKEDLETAERICFRVEEAQWYYEDFIRPLDPTLPSMTLKHFCEEIFAHCPLLSPFSEDHRRKAFDAFLSYKKRVPVRGAILLNRDMDKVVLVKGWKKGANWSFPRGKINKDEDDLDCAVREVYEETGFDLGEAGFVPADRRVKSIDLNMHEQQIRLFVFRDIPLDTHFEPRTRKEISAIDWWRLSDLPAFRKKKTQAQQPVNNVNKFYMVAPFLTHLRKWIVEQKNQESDQGAESNTEAFPQSNINGANIKSDIYTEKTSLGGLPPISNQYHHIVQPVHKFQGQPQQHLNGNTGTALLELLHNKTKPTSRNSPLDFPVRPPNYQTEPSCAPSASVDQDPRVPYFSNLPQAANHQAHEPSDDESIVYQQPRIGIQYSQMIEAQKHIQATQQRRNLAGPHSHQPQHLIHPQPLPPHVQRTIFAQSPIPLSPLAPKIAPNPDPVLSKTSQYSPPHVSKISEHQKQGSLKLTNHTFALLNSFRNRDSRDDEEYQNKNHLVRKYDMTPDTEYMFNNLPAVPTPPVRRIVEDQETPMKAPNSSWHPMSIQLAQDESNYAQQQELEMARRRAAREQGLLQESDHCTVQGIWRQASMKDDVNRDKRRTYQNNDYQNRNQSWHNQTGSLVTPQSYEKHEFVSQRSRFQNSETPSPPNKFSQQNHHRLGHVPEINPGTNLPFRALTILSRPSDVNNQPEYPVKSDLSQPISLKNKQENQLSDIHQKSLRRQSPTFKPQILKRQSSKPQFLESIDRLPPKPGRFSESPKDQEYKYNQSNEHRQNLLSLFDHKVPSPPPHVVKNRFSMPIVNDAYNNYGVKSISSENKFTRKANQPLSPANKGFLLDYLNAVVAKGAR
ncbi:hypothetical protein K3495_g555 [Podosphaera aphanis]|nr:hypothetical protein K3495_g555 [Podosphaera aphanis]